MNELPPRARLTRVVSALARHLPGELPVLLGGARFERERAVLQRLAVDAHVRAAAEALSDPEAAWLAELLLERWADIGTVQLEPIVAIVAPREVWLGDEPLRCTARVAVDGVEPGWRARWDGERVDDDQRHAPELTLELRPGRERARDVTLHLSVEARHGSTRLLLIDQAQIRVRTPLLVISDDRRQLLIRDQHERPAAHVPVEIAGSAHHTSAQGVVQLPEPAPAGAEVRVAGVFAAHVPGREG